MTGGKCVNCETVSPILVWCQGYQVCSSCEALTYLPWWQREEASGRGEYEPDDVDLTRAYENGQWP